LKVITTKQANGSFNGQLINNITSSSKSWFSLSNNQLNGNYYPIPSSPTELPSHIGIWTSSLEEETSGIKIVGDSNLSNGENVILIQGNWSAGMHYATEEDYGEVRDDGSSVTGKHYWRWWHNSGSGNWMGLFGRYTQQLQAGKWYRASVYVRSNYTVTVAPFLIYTGDANNVRPIYTITQRYKWERIAVSFYMDPSYNNSGRPYLYGHYGPAGTYIDWDGYLLEGPFDNDPGTENVPHPEQEIGFISGYGTKKAFYFDGQDDYIELPQQIILNKDNARIKASFYVDDFTAHIDRANSVAFLTRDYATYSFIGLMEGRLHFETDTNNDGGYLYSNSITTGQWFDVEIEFVNGTANLYVNDALEDSLTITDNITVGFIGKCLPDSSFQSYYPSWYDGMIKDIVIETNGEVVYNTKNLQEDLGTLYGVTKVDDGTGNIVRPSLTADGISTIQIPLTLPDNGTIEMWYYPEQFYSYNTLWDNSIDPNVWKCWIDSTGVLQARLNTAYVSCDLNNLGGVKSWYHIAFTWEKTGNISLFVDGNLIESTPITGWVNPGTYFYIFGGNSGNTKGKGICHDCRVWNVARTQQEIQRDMNKPLAGDETGLIGYWRLDEGSGDVAYDLTSNGNNGVIYNGTWTTTQAPAVLRLQDTRSIHTLRLAGDNNLNAYPVDFDIQLYDNSGNKLYEENVTDNNIVELTKQLPQVYDIGTMDISIHKVNNAAFITEISNIFDFSRTDSIKPKTLTTNLVGISINSQDNIKSKINDTVSQHNVELSSLDSILYKIVNSSFFRQYEFKSSDVTTTRVSENKEIVVTFSTGDSLTLTTSQVKDIIVEILKSDPLIVREDIEYNEITVDLSSNDILKPLTADLSNPTNVHTKMDEPFRKIYGKVEITYTDPFLDGDLTINASETNRATNVKDVSDGFDTVEHKYFSLHNNKLDGTYHPVPTQEPVGWWNNTLSNGTGMFDQPPQITVTFETPRPVVNLKVAGDNQLNNYPVDFTIELYDASNTLLHSEQVVDNTQLIWNKAISEVQSVAKLVLTISKINKPYSVAKITEFYTAVRETYYNDDIIDIDLLEELEYPTGTISISAISANEIDITLDNKNNKFSEGSTISSVWKYLKKNRKVKAWLGVEIISGEIEWYPLGTFWTTQWNVPTNRSVAHVTARDILELMRFTDFETSQVYVNYTLYQLFELVLQDFGLTNEEYIIDDNLQNIIIPYAWFERDTHRKALEKLASCALIQVYCDRQNRIVVTPNKSTNTLMYVYADDVNIFDKQFPMAWSEIANYVEVESITYKQGTQQIVYEDNSTIDIGPGESITLTYTYSMIPVMNAIQPIITGGADIVVTQFNSYAWGAEVTFTNNGTSSQQITSITIEGTPLQESGRTICVAKDETLIRENGKIKATLSSDFIQNTSYAQQLANEVLDTFKDARQDIELDTKGNIALKLQDKIKAPGQVEGNTNYYLVSRQQIHWAGALSAQVIGKKIS
jgi:hypothetical protein